MSEELPSVNDFIEDRSNFSSVESITEENLPSITHHSFNNFYG